jgi:hypothetical protein
MIGDVVYGDPYLGAKCNLSGDRCSVFAPNGRWWMDGGYQMQHQAPKHASMLSAFANEPGG